MVYDIAGNITNAIVPYIPR